MSSLGEILHLKMVQVSSQPRLGERLSLERETKSLNPTQGRLGE